MAARIGAPLIAALLVAAGAAANGGAVAAAGLPAVEIDGRPYADPLITMEANRLLVPLRAVAEALGATVRWDGGERRITVQRGARTVLLRVGAAAAEVNGWPVPLAAAPRIAAGRTLIPFRFLGESLGAEVGWDAGRRVAWLRTTGAAAAPLRTVSGYTVVTGWKDTRSADAVRAHGRHLTEIATVSHRLQADGSVAGTVQAEALAAARQQGARAWLAVQNLDAAGNFSAAIAEAFLQSPEARRRFADRVVPLLQEHGFVGLEIDLEFVPAARRPDLSRFLQELKAELAARGLLLGIAVPAKTHDAPADSWGGAYDYAAIGASADRVTLMTYDEHWFGGTSGPIASLPWVERVLQHATRAMPAGKILLGVPAYAYDWRLDGGPARVLGGRRAEELARVYGESWDEAAASPFVRYTDATGAAHVVWYENGRSLKLKADLAARYGLQGLAIWRLGIEGEGLWQALAEQE